MVSESIEKSIETPDIGWDLFQVLVMVSESIEKSIETPDIGWDLFQVLVMVSRVPSQDQLRSLKGGNR